MGSRERALRVALRFKSTEILWNWMLDNGHRGYDVVVVIREDVYFVKDVDLSRFSDPSVVYATGVNQWCKVDPALAGMTSDRVIVFGGRAANALMRWHSELYSNPDPRLTGLGSPETFFQTLASVKGLVWSIVPADWLPHFVATHMEIRRGMEGVLCFRGMRSKDLDFPAG